ncbi:MAG: rhodanese-like domain-containing protein [Brumimicrobium sp.]|nr:rhodanese-like domain-containing protein [Brumimicrobium sp.]
MKISGNIVLKNLLLPLFAVFTLFSCAQEIDPDYKSMIERKYDFPTLSQDSAQMLLNKDSVVFLDTREKEEYNASHLPGALLFGFDDPNWEILDTIPKDSQIIVYCSIGDRSQRIGKKLRERGYKNVKNLYGGIFLWADQSRPMEDSKGEPTSKVHGYNRFWGRWVKKAETVYE